MNGLFDSVADAAANLLPEAGILNDCGVIFTPTEADDCFRQLLCNIAWQPDSVYVGGRYIVTARQMAWYGDGPLAYRYSGVTRTARPWTPLLDAIRRRVEERLSALSPVCFNSCLLNLYVDGSQGMAWHSDDEACLGREPLIASLSLGAVRTFALRHKDSRRRYTMPLAHGQLVVMRGATQTHWQHAILKSATVHSPRINLTFRTVLPP